MQPPAGKSTATPHCRIAVLVPLRPGEPGCPEDRPIGRAALLLADEGVEVVFAHRARSGMLSGFQAKPGRWVAVQDVAAVAAYDRYPSQTDPAGYARLVAAIPELPVVNPMPMTLLCRDKLATQRVLEQAGLPTPPVEEDPLRFAERLEAWGSAFLKPRYGAFGRGVRRVEPGDLLPARGEGAVPGVEEPLLLQRAVLPPAGWAGISVRVLVQRSGQPVKAGWLVNRGIARRSRTDPVVNASRGAEVALASEVLGDAVAELSHLAEAATAALAAMPTGDLLVEVGVDAVIGHDGRPVLVEVNSWPRGRLEVIAALDPTLRAEHVQACARPLRWLARRFGT